MASKSNAVSVGTTATRLDLSTDDGDGVFGSSVAVENNGSSTIFLGGADVSTANGFPLPAGVSVTFNDIPAAEALYGIVASGTVEARVLEVGVG